jgi:hypothetical protein
MKNRFAEIFLGNGNIFATGDVGYATFINRVSNRFLNLAFVAPNKALSIDSAFIFAV